jgi:PTH1 family peptidyl-tRNA hydrolase
MTPNTYMNLSGKPVVKAAEKHSIKESEILVIHDELEMPVGKWKHVGPGLSSRGQNGLKSIIEAFGGKNEFQRIRVGIGRPESREPKDVASYVL